MAVNRHVFYFLFFILFLLLLLFLFIFISLVPPQCRNAPPLPFSMHVSGIFALSKATSTSPLPYSTYKLPNGDCVVLPSPMPLFSTDLRQWAIRIDEVETQVARGARLHFNLVSCPPQLSSPYRYSVRKKYIICTDYLRMPTYCVPHAPP